MVGVEFGAPAGQVPTVLDKAPAGSPVAPRPHMEASSSHLLMLPKILELENLAPYPSGLRSETSLQLGSLLAFPVLILGRSLFCCT